MFIKSFAIIGHNCPCLSKKITLQTFLTFTAPYKVVSKSFELFTNKAAKNSLKPAIVSLMCPNSIYVAEIFYSYGPTERQ